MERRFEFQDLAALGAIGVGLAVGVRNAKSAGVTTDDIVRAYSNVSPITDATPIPVLQKTQMSQQNVLSRIAEAVQIRNDFNSKKVDRILKGMASEPLSSNELNAAKFGLLEYATSPQINPQLRTQFLAGDDIGSFAAKIFQMNEPQIRDQVQKAASISTLSEQRKNLGNIIGNKSRSASRFRNDLSNVARVFDVKAQREKVKPPVKRSKKIFKSMTANMSYSAVLDKNVRKYPLRDKILTLSSDFSNTFQFKGGAQDPYKQVEEALEGLGFKNSLNDSLRKEIMEKFKQTEKNIGNLKSKGIIPNTGNLSFTVMGMKGMDQPAVYLNVPFGETIDEARGRRGFQVPLNRPNYISNRGTSTPVYFSTAEPRNPIALNAMTMRAGNVSEMGNIQGGSRLVNTIDAVFFGGSDNVPIEKVPFYEAIINSKKTPLPLDNDDPVLNRAAARQRGVPVEDVAERLKQGNIFTVNPLDSLFGTGDDKAKYGQSIIGSIDNDVAKSQVMVQRGRMIGISGLSDLLDNPQFTSKDIFSDIHGQLNNTIYNYGGRHSILRINASSVSPGQVGIEPGGISAVSFDLANPEALDISQEQIDDLIKSENGSTRGVNQLIKDNIEKITEQKGNVNSIMDEYTHFGLLEGTGDPAGFTQGRRPSQPLIDVFQPTQESFINLRNSDYVFRGEGQEKLSLFSPLDEIGVSNREMPSDVRRTRINRRYLFMHPDVERDVKGGVVARTKSRLQEGLSVAITDKVNPEFYGQSVKSKIFLGQSETIISERMQKLTEALFSMPEESRKDSNLRKRAIRKALYEGDPTIQAHPRPVFKRGDFLGVKMDARAGLDFSGVDFGGMPEYVLEDAYIDGDNLDLEFKPIIKSQQASKVMLSSKTTQLAMSSDEFIDAMKVTEADAKVTNLLSRSRIDAVADATEIVRKGNLNAIRSQQAGALAEVVTDIFEKQNVRLTQEGARGSSASFATVKKTKDAIDLLNLAMVSGETEAAKGYRYSNFSNNVDRAREILEQRKASFGQGSPLSPVIKSLEEMLNRPRATSSLLEILTTFGRFTKKGQTVLDEDIFGIFGLEKVKEKDGSLIEGLRSIQDKGKYQAGILGVMSDKGARDLTSEVLGELTKDEKGTSLLADNFLSETLERVGIGLKNADINTSFIRGQAATTFRTTGSIFEADQVSMERRAIHSILNVDQFVSEDGKINFRNLFTEDLVSQIQGPSKQEAILAGSLLGKNGLLDLARGNEPIEVLTTSTQLGDRGRNVALPFLGKHVSDPTLYMPSKEEEVILQRNIQIGNQVLDRSYSGKIDEIKGILGKMSPEDMASFDPKSTQGQNLINAFNEAKVVAFSTATDINERFFSGAMIGSIYTQQQAAYTQLEDNLKIADNLVLKSSSKGGGLVNMVNRREAERLLQGARRVGGEELSKQLAKELLEDRTPVLEIMTRSPTITGTPRIASLVQYDPDLDYEVNSKGNYFKTEVDGKVNYVDIDDIDESVEVSRDKKGEKIRYSEVDTGVRRQGYAIAELIEGGKAKEVTIDAYMLSGTSSDFDGDFASKNLYVGGNRQQVQDFLTSEDGRRQMLGYIYNQTSMQVKYEDMVKASPRMQAFESLAKQSGEVIDDSVRSLSQHAGQAEIGKVSSAITQLKLLSTYGKEARVQSLGADITSIKAIEGSYERFMGFLQGLEQVPISFKHSSAGETPAAKLTSEIMGIFSNTDQVEAEKAMQEFLTGWMGGDEKEVSRITSEWMDNFMKTAVSYSVASEEIRDAIKLSTRHSEDVAKMSPEEFKRIFKGAMPVGGMSAVTATYTHSLIESAAASSSIKGNADISAINNNLQEKADEVMNKIKSSVAEQAKSATLNEKGKAFSKIAKPVGAGLAAAGLIYAMFDQGKSADNLEEPEGRRGLEPPAGIRINNPQRDTNLNVPYEDREMNYAPNTIDRRTVGSSNTGRINSRAQVSQNVNALEVARAMQSTIPHAQIGVNLQYSNKMNPRLEQDL